MFASFYTGNGFLHFVTDIIGVDHTPWSCTPFLSFEGVDAGTIVAADLLFLGVVSKTKKKHALVTVTASRVPCLIVSFCATLTWTARRTSVHIKRRESWFCFLFLTVGFADFVFRWRFSWIAVARRCLWHLCVVHRVQEVVDMELVLAWTARQWR